MKLISPSTMQIDSRLQSPIPPVYTTLITLIYDNYIFRKFSIRLHFDRSLLEFKMLRVVTYLNFNHILKCKIVLRRIARFCDTQTVIDFDTCLTLAKVLITYNLQVVTRFYCPNTNYKLTCKNTRQRICRFPVIFFFFLVDIRRPFSHKFYSAPRNQRFF